MPIHVTQVFAESLPFKDNSFDLVYGRQVLHHAADLKNMACELSRVLKPGGAFIATREHVISHPDDLNTFLNNHPLHHIYGKENAYLLKDYISSLNNAGIKLNEVINPFESDINRFPQTLNDIKYNLAKMIHFPFPNLIPQILIKVYGDHISTPGRLYSFLGVKQ